MVASLKYLVAFSTLDIVAASAGVLKNLSYDSRHGKSNFQATLPLPGAKRPRPEPDYFPESVSRQQS
jgi:hypothetical protein